MRRRVLGAGASALIAVAFTGPAAHAQQSSSLSAQLSPLNRSGAAGSAMVTLAGNQVTVRVDANGVSGGVPHAQHIHIGGTNTCPTASAGNRDEPRDLISTAEGQPSYGEVKVSLTTEGDVGAGSALAVERFPAAAQGGTYTYSRTFDLPSGVTGDDVRNGVIVVHGISKLFADQAMYDGDPRSSLDPNLPLEATIPALCGKLSAAQVGSAPVGGVAAGAGATAPGDLPRPLLGAAVGLIAGMVVMLAAQGRRVSRSLSR